MSCFNQGISCRCHTTEEGREEKGPFSHLSTTSALHGVKAPWQLTPGRQTAHLGPEKGRHPLIHFPCWSLVLEESPPSPASESSVLPVPSSHTSSHTPALVKVTLACTCLDIGDWD